MAKAKTNNNTGQKADPKSKTENTSKVTEIPASPPPPPTPLFRISGLPVYQVNKESDFASTAKIGDPIYFLLGKEKQDKKDALKLYRVMNTFFGISSVEVSISSIASFEGSLEGFSCKLPKISWQLVHKMDVFFREAFKKHGTESIVMLTYDRDALESENPCSGWDFYVPPQTNTNVNCDYELSEILKHIDNMPGNVELVGTAHSHPEMSAYFSPTDEHDQATFEGIHITYGWKKGSKVGETEYKIGATMNQAEWPIDVVDWFEVPPIPEQTLADIEELVDRVQKKVQTPTTTGYQGGSFNTGKGGATTHNPQIGYRGGGVKSPEINLPEKAPDPRDTMILQEFDGEFDTCRACNAPITSTAIDQRRCYACRMVFISYNESLSDVIDARKEQKCVDIPNLNIQTTKYPIVIWGLDDKFEEIFTPPSDKEPNAEKK